MNCSTLERFSDFPELWYELMWEKKYGNFAQVSKINITLQNKIGTLNKITACIKKINSNIVDLKINKRSEDFFELEIYVQIKNIKHLEDLIVALKLEDCVYNIVRV